MTEKDKIKSFWLTFIIICCVFIIWLVLMRLIDFGIDYKIILAFCFAFAAPIGIFILITKMIIIFKQKLLNIIKKRKGSKPFEFLFFMFLFAASFYLSTLVATAEDPTKLLEKLYLALGLGTAYGATVCCGWLHYIEAIHD